MYQACNFEYFSLTDHMSQPPVNCAAERAFGAPADRHRPQFIHELLLLLRDVKIVPSRTAKLDGRVRLRIGEVCRVYPRCFPQRILSAHLPDEVADLAIDPRRCVAGERLVFRCSAATSQILRSLFAR